MSNGVYTLSINTAANGSGSANTDALSGSRLLIGVLAMIDLKYHASAAASTSVQAACIRPDGSTFNLGSAIVGNTSIQYMPVIPQYSSSGATGLFTAATIYGKLSITVSNAGGALTGAVTASLHLLPLSRMIF